MSDVGGHSQVVILSGPSGSGKTTIIQNLLKRSPVPLEMSISATTRPPRVGEVEGKNYYFLSPEEFARRRQAGEFLECAEVHRSGYWYGTLKSEVDRICNAGMWVLLEIDVEGALNVMKLYPKSLSIFLATSSAEEYERRLRARGTETEEAITRRLQTALAELKLADSYRYRVINDDLDRAVGEICDLLSAQSRETGSSPC